MGSIDYQKLYLLQDEVLKVVFATEHEFCLTGGTCLSRFYVEKRYSDDLDFFTNQSSRYSFAIKNIKKALQDKFEVVSEVESKDFTRFKINDFTAVFDSVYKDHEEVIVYRKGRENVVMISMKETEYLLSNPKNKERLLSSLKHAREGKVKEKELIES